MVGVAHAVVVPGGRVVRSSLAVVVSSLALAACARSERATIAAPAVEPPQALHEPAACVQPPAAHASEGRAATNVEGGALATCSTDPMTGVHRDGRCTTGPHDVGVHVVCARVTEEFLRFTAARGNDLTTPARGFPGLRPGQRWCLCASRWAEAEAAGVAPPVVLEATDGAALRTIPIDALRAHAAAASP
jgi:uncharacterized protein (DUF2237 family)